MGKKIGIWLDNEKAYVISLRDGKHAIEKIESNVETRMRFEGESKSFSKRGGALFNPSKKRTNRKKHQMSEYMNNLVGIASNAEGIYIFGPAEAKRELNKALIKRYDKPPVYIESADKMTENQMIAQVKEYFISS